MIILSSKVFFRVKLGEESCTDLTTLRVLRNDASINSVVNGEVCPQLSRCEKHDAKVKRGLKHDRETERLVSI